MKNSIFLKSSVVVILLLLTFPVLAQTNPEPGLFQRIGNWFTGGVTSLVITFIAGIFAKKGWSQIIKSFAHKTAEVTKEVGELFTNISQFSAILDNSIKEDGTIEQNSVKELLNSGKSIVAEGKDVIISIKPKPI